METNAPSGSEHKDRKYAVVQWDEGEDCGRFSDVKTDCIRGYDDSKMDQNGYPISTYSVFIEWRYGKKQRGVWPHYPATVIFVSATRYGAIRKLNALLKERQPAELSKRVSVPPQKYQDDTEDSDLDETEILTQPVKKTKALTREDPAEEFHAMDIDLSSPAQLTHHDESLPETLAELQQENQSLKEENAGLIEEDDYLKEENADLKEEIAHLKEMLVQAMPAILKYKNVPDVAETARRSSLELSTPPLLHQSSSLSRPGSSGDSLLPPSTSTPESVLPSARDSQLSKMEIHPGTGVMIEKVAWACALNAKSATGFVRRLLTSVFPMEVLLVSSLCGGKRGRGEARLPLDKTKLDAIYSATLTRWPEIQPSSIGSMISARIAELRAAVTCCSQHD